MDRRLLDLYNRELAHLRATGAEFAKEFPKIAGRLGGLDEFQPCQDPFVERLLEGFAFLAARVQLKLNAEFPRFSQSLVETIYLTIWRLRRLCVLFSAIRKWMRKVLLKAL